MKPRPCVRCGKQPRREDLFICDDCYAKPVHSTEIREAMTACGRDGQAQRRWLVAEKGWKGGWGTRGA